MTRAWHAYARPRSVPSSLADAQSSAQRTAEIVPPSMVAGAFLLYLLVSILVFGLKVIRNPSLYYIGNSADSTAFIWMLFWWPHAILRGLNPFHTSAVWAPGGCNLTWSTSIPALSLIVSPATLTWGAVPAFNLLALLGPAASATAVFALCTTLWPNFWPALFGGYLFGFSPYIVAHMLACHLSLVWMPYPPLLVYLVVLLISQAIKERTFVRLFACALVLQFLTSIETFALNSTIGVAALALAIMFAESDARHSLWSLSIPLGKAYAACGLIVSPYLYYFFFRPQPFFATIPMAYWGSLRSFLVPNSNLFISHHQWIAVTHHHFAAVSPELHGTFYEPGGYLGPGLFLLVALSALTARRGSPARLLVACLIVSWLFSLGPYAEIGGWRVPLPWLLFSKTPVLRYAIPVRLEMYVYLAAALAAVVCLRDLTASSGAKLGLALIAIIFLVPDVPYTDLAVTKVNTPPFFTTGMFRKFLRQDETALVLPYGFTGNTMLWQVQANLYFRMAGGYLGISAPKDFATDAEVMKTLYFGSWGRTFPNDLHRFLITHHVGAVILGPGTEADDAIWNSVLGVHGLRIGGVLFYRLSEPDLGTQTAGP